MSAVHRLIRRFTREVRESLPDIDTMSDEELALVLLAYAHFVAPNFVPWMVRTWINCRSEVAKEACRDNLVCEINEDHPAMLHRFVAPIQERYLGICQIIDDCLFDPLAVRSMEDLMTTGKGIDGLVVMAALENTSLVFIPWIEKAAKRLGVTDLTYTQKHGVADEKHATQFLEAVEAELPFEEDFHPSTAISDVRNLLESIFLVNEYLQVCA